MKLIRTSRSPYADVPFFTDWTAPELALLERLVEVVELEPGDVLVHAGRRSQEFYVVARGRVQLLEGRRHAGVLQAGDSLGAEGLLSGAASPVTAVAETCVQALVLGPRQFRGLLHEAPSMGRRLATLLAERLAAIPA